MGAEKSGPKIFGNETSKNLCKPRWYQNPPKKEHWKNQKENFQINFTSIEKRKKLK